MCEVSDLGKYLVGLPIEVQSVDVDGDVVDCGVDARFGFGRCVNQRGVVQLRCVGIGQSLVNVRMAAVSGQVLFVLDVAYESTTVVLPPAEIWFEVESSLGVEGEAGVFTGSRAIPGRSREPTSRANKATYLTPPG